MTRPVEDWKKIERRVTKALNVGCGYLDARIIAAISAAMAAIYPGRQKKSVKEWRAIRAKGFNAACRALRRKR
jgi:hypothetical protein